MKRGLRMAAIAALVGLVAAAIVGATSAPAGNRSPVSSLLGVPGPSEVTYGQNVAYSASLLNNGKSNYTHLQFSNPIPKTVVNGSPVDATFKYASCPGQLTATAYVCNETTLTAGLTAKVTIVWQTPTAGASSDCPGSTPVCMTNTALWQIKDSQPGGNDTFPTNTVVTSLLVVPDQRKAGGYPLTTCSSSAGSQLETFPVSPGNPLQTRVCETSLPVGDPLNPGSATTISERDRTPSDTVGITQVSDICIAAPNNTCTPGYTEFVSPTFQIFTFVIDNRTTGNEKIDQVWEDGNPVSFDQSVDPHVVSITINNAQKITTVVVASKSNGGWTFS
jgi:uncharacterized repeat protein (TIGR01451 family)